MEQTLEGTIRAALREGGSAVCVTFYGPDGHPTSAFEEARVWHSGNRWGSSEMWLDLEERGGLVRVTWPARGSLDDGE